MTRYRMHYSYYWFFGCRTIYDDDASATFPCNFCVWVVPGTLDPDLD